MKKYDYFITTPIYYPSGNLHVGHLYTCLICDIYKRFLKQKQKSCFFLTGSDNHGEKILKSANACGEAPENFVKKNVSKFIELWNLYKIDYDFFIQTNNKYHVETVKNIIDDLFKNKYIYKSNYSANYCFQCEEYFTIFQSKNNICLNCNRELKKLNEQAYFLKIVGFKKWITQMWKKNIPEIIPKSIITEMKNNFIDNNFNDLCISREDFGWGIKFPFDKNYSVYVWLDALINYLSATGYKNNGFNLFDKIWGNNDTQIVHVLGKEITRFHCIYWPIILKMLNLRMPSKFLAHGWIVTDEGKMSKSKKNVIDPVFLAKKYGVDAIRYCLISQMHQVKDYKLTEEEIVRVYNNELANIYGNLFCRVNKLYLIFFNNSSIYMNKRVITEDFTYKNEYNQIIESVKKYNNHFYNLEFKLGCEKILEVGKLLNKFIEDEKPWKFSKIDNKLINIFDLVLIGLKTINEMLNPILLDFTKLTTTSFPFKKTKTNEIMFKSKVTSLKIIFQRIK